MLAPSHDLRPDVQQSALLGEDEEVFGCLVVEGDAHLLGQAQVAVGVARFVDVGFPYNVCLQLVWFSCVFEFPYLRRECCAWSLFLSPMSRRCSPHRAWNARFVEPK